MARTKQSEAPAGALGDGDLQRWLQLHRAELGSSGIKASFGQAPRSGGHPGATWVSMTSAHAHGRLVRSADGATTVRAHALPAGAPLPDDAPLLDEQCPHTTVAQLEALVAALASTSAPTAARA